jgi:hypothetical protein
VTTKSCDQGFGVPICGIRSLVQFRAQRPVRKYEPAEDTQAELLRGGEQGDSRARKMRTKNQGGRGAVGRERRDKFARDGRCVNRVGQPRFFRQCALFQPIEQAVSQTADDADLGEVHVRVDESRQDVTAAQIANRGIRMGLHDGTVIAAIGHFAILDCKGSVSVRDQCVRVEKRVPGGVKDGGSENVHPRMAPVAGATGAWWEVLAFSIAQ